MKRSGSLVPIGPEDRCSIGPSFSLFKTPETTYIKSSLGPRRQARFLTAGLLLFLLIGAVIDSDMGAAFVLHHASQEQQQQQDSDTAISNHLSHYNPNNDNNNNENPDHNRDLANDLILGKEGADLDLSCPIEQPAREADMIINWMCQDEPASIRSSRIHVTPAGKLRIKSAKLGDSCNYRCEAADGFGTISVVIRVLIVDRGLINNNNHKHNKSSHMNSGTSEADQLTGVLAPSRGAKLRQQSEQTNNNNKNNTQHVNNNHQNNNQIHKQQQQHPMSGLEILSIQIEPNDIRVSKNGSFTLECKVEHSPNSRMGPQILWLKEFIGNRPNSMREAHEQNLINIDDVYYHSLNWPNTISHEKPSSISTSSALLVRRASYVHSGNYICFAAFPPALMMFSTNLSLNDANNNNINHNDNNANDNITSQAPADPGYPPKSLRYKMVMSRVQVDDEPGRANHLTSLGVRANALSNDPSQGGATPRPFNWFWSPIRIVVYIGLFISAIWFILRLIMYIKHKLIGTTNKPVDQQQLQHNQHQPQQQQNHYQQQAAGQCNSLDSNQTETLSMRTHVYEDPDMSEVT